MHRCSLREGGWQAWIGGFTLLALVLAGSWPAFGAGELPTLGEASLGLFVTGEGEVALPADTAYVNLGIENTARTTAEAQRDNARVTTAVIQCLLAQGVPADRIKSAGFGLYPQTTFDPQSRTERLTGYRVSNRLTVTLTDLSNVGAVVDAAIAAGATNVYDVSFTARDVSSIQAAALRKAVLDARAKAQAMAESLGVKVGRVLSATDDVSAAGPPVLMRLKSADSAATTPFLPGEVRVRAQVTVQFALE